ncbi:MAG: hypothetical protein A2Z88_08005 [Omnitrophica WOR_2 bacterium GWA2_47_8]|nr:MAG: hypothetical protein A2Z88_08005 [Omnitrophica WOR_2 bacterium GWA2_47_8]
MQFNLNEIIDEIGAKVLQGNADIRIRGVSINSRTIRKGELYIAIVGKRLDGHDFIGDCIKKGAAAVIVSKKGGFKKDIPVLYVKDTTKSLGFLARFYRRKFKIPLIAITGSSGKTTTKEMAAHVLSSRYNVLKNIATENNQFGVPLTLFRLNPRHEMVVLELGTNCFGDIKWLAQIAEPTEAIFTNIGASHLEFLRSPAGVLKEKSDLVKYMSPTGKVILNYDDPYLRGLKVGKRQKIISYGVHARSRYKAEVLPSSGPVNLRFQIHKQIFELKTPVQHNIYNALAAISAARLFKVDVADIQRRLKSFRFPKGRFMINQRRGSWIIDDTYNANPVSFRSAIETLAQIRNKGKKILICADMLELGEKTERLHREVGVLAGQLNINLVLGVGKLAKFICEDAKRNNTDVSAFHFDTVNKLHQRLPGFFKPGDAILVKGSRGMHMEQTVEFLNKLLTHKN